MYAPAKIVQQRLGPYWSKGPVCKSCIAEVSGGERKSENDT
jgi:hypothetical protein